MPQPDSVLQKARSHDRLWPTIADAVDTYVRRGASQAHGYERVWRLIHIWESVEITLAAVGITRLAKAASVPDAGVRAAEEFRRCRELCYGKSWDAEERSFKTQQGAFDGSIDRWIDILWHLARLEAPSGNFLPSLKAFLNAETITIAPFLEVWRNACDVPVKADNKPIPVKECIRQVNTFRNRFAHVPFPPLPIERVADALEEVTEQLFKAKGEEGGPEPWNTKGVLTGAILDGGRFLRGSGRTTLGPPNTLSVSEMSFVFTYDQKEKEHEHWPAVPFAHMDASMNGYILTRLKGQDQGTWEYTRFKAETSPVITLDKVEWVDSIRPPHPTEYPIAQPDAIDAGVETPQEAPSAQIEARKVESFSDAIDAMRHDDFAAAVAYLETYVIERPRYHIGWLKLGIARREKAVRLPDDEENEAKSLFEKSIEALTEATKHIDPEYKASALYERSKSYFRLSRLTSEATSLKNAWEDAATAAKISADERYFTWVDYLERLRQDGQLG